MFDSLLSKVYKYSLLAMSALMILSVGSCMWNDNRRKVAVAEKAVVEGQLVTAVDANKAMVKVNGMLLTSIVQTAAFNTDVARIVEKHYITERAVDAQAAAIQSERSNANLEDGAVSADLGLTLDRLRRWSQNENCGEAGAGAGCPQAGSPARPADVRPAPSRSQPPRP